jgi:hypothetical protein
MAKAKNAMDVSLEARFNSVERRIANVDKRLTDIGDRLNKCVTNEDLRAALTLKGWKRAIGFIKGWSPVGAVVAIIIFILVQWGEYREFRGGTNKAIATLEATTGRIEKNLTDMQAELFAIRARMVSSEPSRPQNQTAAKELLAEAIQRSISIQGT